MPNQILLYLPRRHVPDLACRILGAANLISSSAKSRFAERDRG